MYVFALDLYKCPVSKCSLLSRAPALASPRMDQPFHFQVDASDVGAGAVLLQIDENGVERPVIYFSKKFKVYRRHYSKKEALALVGPFNSLMFMVGQVPNW